jgi:hypothetical protein
MKICSLCQRELPLESFNKRHRSGHDYYYTTCKECRRLQRREIREKYPETYKGKDGKYYKRHKEDIAKKRNDWGRENKDKVSAHNKVNYALRKGVLVKSVECEECGGGGEIVAHHEDYSKPLEVKWLCPKCHMRLHAAACA